MSRLPRPGEDNGEWGDILNDFLAVSHMDDGTIRVESLPEIQIADGSITPAKLSQAYIPATSKGMPDGVALLDSGGKISSEQIPSDTILTDATATTKGVVQLSGDLSGTATAPTVPGLITKYTYPAGGIPLSDLASDVQTKINTGGSVGDATSASKGILLLAGDLGGSAANPTVPALTNKVNISAVGAANGVASLDTTAKVPMAQMPTGIPVDGAVVHLEGEETITGLKTFTSSPEVPIPEQPNDAASKQYVDATKNTVRVPAFSSTGQLVAQQGTQRLYNDSGTNWTIDSVRASVGMPSSGASVVVDIDINGASVFTSASHQPIIAAGAYTSGKVTTIDTPTVPDGGYLTVDVDQIGTTTPGSDLTVQLEVH